MTKEERHLWYDFLRGYPVRFMRQRPIDRYIADFYCAGAKLVVELDGSQHCEDEGRQADAARDQAFAALGITVLRIPNSEIQRNYPGVCERIDLEVQRLAPFAKGNRAAADSKAPFAKGSCRPLGRLRDRI